MVIILGLIFSVSSCTSHNHHHGNAVKNPSVSNEGRIEELDDLLRSNIEVINTNKPEFMGKLIKMADQIMETMPENDLAGYYVRLLKHIESKGIDFVHDERDRLNLIIGTTQGAEKEHARYQKNIVEGLVDMIAENLMMARMAGDLDMFGSYDLESIGNRHDEV